MSCVRHVPTVSDAAKRGEHGIGEAMRGISPLPCPHPRRSSRAIMARCLYNGNWSCLRPSPGHWRARSQKTRAPHRRNAMVISVLAASASAWGVLMGFSPVLQIRRMLRERSSREVSLGYFAILLAGFLLWIAYGIAAGNMWLVVPNSIALLVGLTLIAVALRLRRS